MQVLTSQDTDGIRVPVDFAMYLGRLSDKDACMTRIEEKAFRVLSLLLSSFLFLWQLAN